MTKVLYLGDNLETLRRYAGVYTSPIDGRDYPRIQVRTIREHLEEGKKPMLPLLILSPYQQAERIADKKAAEQQELFGG